MNTSFEQFTNSNVMRDMTLKSFIHGRINLMASLQTFGDAQTFKSIRTSVSGAKHLKNVLLYLKCKAGKLDLFNYPDLVPQNVLDVLDQFKEGESYHLCEKVNAELKELGYTFDWGLSAEPYNLRVL